VVNRAFGRYRRPENRATVVGTSHRGSVVVSTSRPVAVREHASAEFHRAGATAGGIDPDQEAGDGLHDQQRPAVRRAGDPVAVVHLGPVDVVTGHGSRRTPPRGLRP
jgi:hypothetical protein